VLGAQIGQDPWRPTHPIGASINGHNGGSGGAAGNGGNAGILVGNGGTGGAGGFGVVTLANPVPAAPAGCSAYPEITG
jgi:hypothetical protein